MLIIETSIFTRQVRDLLSEDEYRELQMTLVSRPHSGTVIKGSGGLRKVRWAVKGRGKRGGVRVIYYWAVAQNRLLMLLMYSKSERDNLTPDRLRILKKTVKKEFS